MYRKVNKLKETDREIFTEFMRLHPYIPRDISTIDFEQLIRESIIFGFLKKIWKINMVFQKEQYKENLEKFMMKIQELFDLYQSYLMLDGKEKLIPIIEKALIGYEKQEPLNEEKQLEKKKKIF